MTDLKDSIRHKILKYLYQIHEHAKGPKGLSQGIREIQAELKKYNIKQQQVTSHLDYLIQKKWISEIIEKHEYLTPSGKPRISETKKYKISIHGIDFIESAHPYFYRKDINQINISDIPNVAIMEHGNIVNIQMIDLYHRIHQLKKDILSLESMNPEIKLHLIADCDSILIQLSKNNISTELIRTIWQQISKESMDISLLPSINEISLMMNGF